MSNYVIVWEFIAKAEAEAAFEKVYCAGGDWDQLFQQSSGFLKTELFKDIEIPYRYIVIDRWESRHHYLDFRENFNQAYEQLDSQARALVAQETRLGAFLYDGEGEALLREQVNSCCVLNAVNSSPPLSN